MNIFRTLGTGSLSVTAMLDFSGKANTSIHGLGEDDTANHRIISLAYLTEDFVLITLNQYQKYEKVVYCRD